MTTLRRRFFPSTPVQAAPAGRVALEVQLRRAPAAAAPAPATEAPVEPVESAATGWLVPMLAAAPAVALAVDVLEEGLTQIYGDYYDEITEVDYTGLMVSLWRGTPAALDGDGRARPVPGPGFVCTELVIDTTYYKAFPGRHFTALAPGGAWEWGWDTPNAEDPENVELSASGHRAFAVGGTLVVAALDTGGDTENVETLTARAYVGGEQVQELIFRAYRYAF